MNSMDHNLSQNNQSQNNQPKDLVEDDISSFLTSKINKYSTTQPVEMMNKMYSMGIFITNHKFDMNMLIKKLDIILDNYSESPLPNVKKSKRGQLINSLIKGIEDGNSNAYRNAYDESGKYVMTELMLQKRATIDRMNDKIISYYKKN